MIDILGGILNIFAHGGGIGGHDTPDLTDYLINGTYIMAALGVLGTVAALTYFKAWGWAIKTGKWIWKEWITSTDPKKIGVMYIIVAIAMLLRGALDAAMMRAQQALAAGDAHGVLTSEHFQQVFTAHGSIMIFFVAMGLLFGLLNIVVPHQIGARDVAFPFMNSASFWLFAAGALLMNLSLFIGNDFAATGWLAYPPLSEREFSPGGIQPGCGGGLLDLEFADCRRGESAFRSQLLYDHS
jgi:cytochrome o ubiquinol oxidase subunit I